MTKIFPAIIFIWIEKSKDGEFVQKLVMHTWRFNLLFVL